MHCMWTDVIFRDSIAHYTWKARYIHDYFRAYIYMLDPLIYFIPRNEYNTHERLYMQYKCTEVNEHVSYFVKFAQRYDS